MKNNGRRTVDRWYSAEKWENRVVDGRMMHRRWVVGKWVVDKW